MKREAEERETAKLGLNDAGGNVREPSEWFEGG